MGRERKHDACEHTLPPCLTTRRSLNKQCELKEDEDPLRADVAGHSDTPEATARELKDKSMLEVIFRTVCTETRFPTRR